MNTYRFQSIAMAVCYMDGWWDCLMSIGKIPPESEYAVCYIKFDKDVRVVLTDTVSNRDYKEVPVCVISLVDVAEEELEQCVEISQSQGPTIPGSRVDTN